jgi:type IX secretion system PorP/SprF family membrane protein
MKYFKTTYKFYAIGAIAFSLMLSALSGKAQTTAPFSYTQYMDNLTPVNSAYSMLDTSGSITGVVRKQWTGIDGAPTTYLLNGNIPLPNIGASMGFIVQNDQVAVEKQTSASLFFAKSIQLQQNGYLAVSLNAGFRAYKANYTSINDNNDPAFANNVSETKPNFGFSVMYYTDKYYLGFSLPQITLRSLGTASVQDNNSFRNQYYFAGAYLFDIGDEFKFKPATLVAYQRGTPVTADISGTLYMKGTLGIGVDYRSTSEMAGILTLNLGQVHFGYSYQFGTNSNTLGGFNNATHEISLTYRFGHGALNPKLL